MDKQFFEKVCDAVIGQQQGMNGIGTLGEKTVHAVLKNYYSPDHINHEIRVGGFVADICTGSEIIEIQTRQFNKLRKKLTAFLEFAPVTIVYPVPYIKYLRWVNPQTGEISPPRKSPKLGTPYAVFDELYKIKPYLTNPNLRLKIVMMNLEEYKFLDGWSEDRKKGSTRSDRIPTELVRELDICSLADYQLLIPDEIDEGFSSKDFKKATKLPIGQARTALHVLHYIGAIERVGKKGNTFLYVRQGNGDGYKPADEPESNKSSKRTQTTRKASPAETVSGSPDSGKSTTPSSKKAAKTTNPSSKKVAKTTNPGSKKAAKATNPGSKKPAKTNPSLAPEAPEKAKTTKPRAKKAIKAALSSSDIPAVK